MNQYYDYLLQQAQGKANAFNQSPVQKTPEMVMAELKEQKYQEFINTPEGAEAIGELRIKFDTWYDERYNPKHGGADAKEIKELKEMVAGLAQQIQSMNRSSVPSTQNNNPNHK